MKQDIKHKVEEITKESRDQVKLKFDADIQEDDYDFLNNIDFFKHIDMTDYEKESFGVKNEIPTRKEEIKVNVDYLDDLAFFDELDYFEQLDKSLEQELKGLDSHRVSIPFETKRRWIRRHSDGILLGAGISVLLLLSGGVVGFVGSRMAKTDDSYAATKYAEATATPGVVQPVADHEQNNKQPHKSEAIIQKRDENEAVRTISPSKTDKPKATSKPKDNNTGAISNEAPEEELKGFYSDSVFIGNSLTEDLKISGGVSTAKYLAVKSLNVNDAMKKRFVGTGSNRQTIPEALSDIKCKKIFIMFGVNELGWPYPKVFGQRYEDLINQVKEIQPDATIYIESILPCAKWLGERDKACKKSNIERFNKEIKDVAKRTGCKYVDLTDSVGDSEGYLPDDAAVDGMHMKKSYNRKWISYMYNLIK